MKISIEEYLFCSSSSSTFDTTTSTLYVHNDAQMKKIPELHCFIREIYGTLKPQTSNVQYKGAWEEVREDWTSICIHLKDKHSPLRWVFHTACARTSPTITSLYCALIKQA